MPADVAFGWVAAVAVYLKTEVKLCYRMIYISGYSDGKQIQGPWVVSEFFYLL